MTHYYSSKIFIMTHVIYDVIQARQTNPDHHDRRLMPPDEVQRHTSQHYGQQRGMTHTV